MKISKRVTGVIVIFTLLILCVYPAATLLASVESGAEKDLRVSQMVEAQNLVVAEVDAGHDDPLSQEKLKDFGWRIANFIALLMILVWFAAKPLGNTLSRRRTQIISEIDELELRKVNAQKTYQELQGRLVSVEADIDKIVERAIAQADIEKEKILEKAEAAAEEMKRSAEQAVQNEVAEARMMLREEVAEKAAMMAEEIIKENLKVNDQKVIIENYLAKVEAMP